MQQITDGVWRVDGPDFPMPLGVKMPLTSTVLRVGGRQLAIYSPVKLDDAQAAAIDAEGEVAYVISPNLFHHAHVPAALARWPQATFHGPPGLATKRKDLPAPKPVAEVAGVRTIRIDGMPTFDEHVLFHEPSGTLVCGDLVFHIARPANTMSKMLFAMTGIGGGKLAQSRVWKSLVKDRAAARASLDAILALPIRRVAPTHGTALDIDAAGLAAIVTR